MISFDSRLPLEEGGYTYLIADKEAMPVLIQIGFVNIDDKQFQQMVDRTQYIAAAVYVTPNSHYRLAAWGNYPASRAKMAFAASKMWKKRRSAVSLADYWHSAPLGYSIAVTSNMALVTNADDPFSAPPGTPVPEGFTAFRKDSILACWLSNPGPAINQRIKEMGIPIAIPAQQLFISLYPEENNRYAAHLQIQAADANQALALAAMFAIARNFSPVGLLPSILFANPPAQDGKNLNIATAPLTAQEIALLLKMFAVE